MFLLFSGVNLVVVKALNKLLEVIKLKQVLEKNQENQNLKKDQ